MNIRLYICPIVGDGLSIATSWRAKVADLIDAHTAVMICNLDGTPKFNWAPVAAKSGSWVNADADSTCSRIFGTNIPDTINAWADMKTFLQSKTIADLSPADRSTLNTLLTSHGLDTSQVTLSTTWWQVVRGIVLQIGGDANSDGISVA